MKEITSDTPEIEQDEISQTVGSLLKDARVEKKLTVENVSQSINLRMAIVNDIESDDFSNIGSTTYAKGYIKNYARLVEVDPQQLQKCIEQQFGKSVEPAMQSFSRKTSREATDSRLIWFTYVIIFALVALFVLWWVQNSELFGKINDFSQPSQEETQLLETEEQVTNFHSEIVPEMNDELVVQEQSTDIVNHDATASEEFVSDFQNDVQPDETSSVIQEQTSEVPTVLEVEAEPSVIQFSEASTEADGLTEINITLTGDCWINVQDSTGKVIIDGLKQSGRFITVSGKAPFKAIIGAPQVVQIQLDGDAVDLSGFPSGKVARMTLPLSE